jgi:hypothetical protein
MMNCLCPSYVSYIVWYVLGKPTSQRKRLPYQWVVLEPSSSRSLALAFHRMVCNPANQILQLSFSPLCRKVSCGQPNEVKRLVFAPSPPIKAKRVETLIAPHTNPTGQHISFLHTLSSLVRTREELPGRPPILKLLQDNRTLPRSSLKMSSRKRSCNFLVWLSYQSSWALGQDVTKAHHMCMIFKPPSSMDPYSW